MTVCLRPRSIFGGTAHTRRVYRVNRMLTVGHQVRLIVRLNRGTFGVYKSSNERDVGLSPVSLRQAFVNVPHECRIACLLRLSPNRVRNWQAEETANIRLHCLIGQERLFAGEMPTQLKVDDDFVQKPLLRHRWWPDRMPRGGHLIPRPEPLDSLSRGFRATSARNP